MPPAQGQSAGSRRRKEQRYRSVISDIFDGSILSLVQCLTCDRVCALRWGGVFRLQQPRWASLGLGWGCVLHQMPLPFSRGSALVAGRPRVGEQALCLTCQLVAGTRGADSAWSDQGRILEGGDPG